MLITFWSEHRKRRANLGFLAVDGTIMLKWILKGRCDLVRDIWWAVVNSTMNPQLP